MIIEKKYVEAKIFLNGSYKRKMVLNFTLTVRQTAEACILIPAGAETTKITKIFNVWKSFLYPNNSFE